MLSPVGKVSKGRVRLRILRWGRPGYSDAITRSCLKTSGPRDSGPVNTPEMRSSFVPPAIWTMVAATPWLWGHTALLPSPPHTNPTSWDLWAPLGGSRLHLPLIWTWGGPLRTWERSVKGWAWGKARRLNVYTEKCARPPQCWEMKSESSQIKMGFGLRSKSVKPWVPGTRGGKSA